MEIKKPLTISVALSSDSDKKLTTQLATDFSDGFSKALQSQQALSSISKAVSVYTAAMEKQGGAAVAASVKKLGLVNPVGAGVRGSPLGVGDVLLQQRVSALNIKINAAGEAKQAQARIASQQAAERSRIAEQLAIQSQAKAMVEASRSAKARANFDALRDKANVGGATSAFSSSLASATPPFQKHGNKYGEMMAYGGIGMGEFIAGMMLLKVALPYAAKGAGMLSTALINNKTQFANTSRTLGSLSNSMERIGMPFAGVVGKFSSMNMWMSHLGKATEGLVPIFGRFAGVVTTLGVAANAAIGGIGLLISGLQFAVGGVFSIVKIAGGALFGAIKMVGGALWGAVKFVGTTVVNLALGIVKLVASPFIFVGKKIVGFFTGILDSIWSAITGALGPIGIGASVGRILSPAIELMTHAIYPIIAPFERLGIVLVQRLSPAFANLGHVLMKLAISFENSKFLNVLTAKILNWSKALEAWLIPLLDRGATALESLDWEKILTSIETFFTGLWEKTKFLRNILEVAGEVVGTFVSRLWQDLKPLLTGLAGNLANGADALNEFTEDNKDAWTTSGQLMAGALADMMIAPFYKLYNFFKGGGAEEMTTSIKTWVKSNIMPYWDEIWDTFLSFYDKNFAPIVERIQAISWEDMQKAVIRVQVFVDSLIKHLEDFNTLLQRIGNTILTIVKTTPTYWLARGAGVLTSGTMGKGNLSAGDANKAAVTALHRDVQSNLISFSKGMAPAEVSSKVTPMQEQLLPYLQSPEQMRAFQSMSPEAYKHFVEMLTLPIKRNHPDMAKWAEQTADKMRSMDLSEHAVGGSVVRTGPAIVHKGEVIQPIPSIQRQTGQMAGISEGLHEIRDLLWRLNKTMETGVSESAKVSQGLGASMTFLSNDMLLRTARG